MPLCFIVYMKNTSKSNLNMSCLNFVYGANIIIINLHLIQIGEICDLKASSNNSYQTICPFISCGTTPFFYQCVCNTVLTLVSTSVHFLCTFFRPSESQYMIKITVFSISFTFNILMNF